MTFSHPATQPPAAPSHSIGLVGLGLVGMALAQRLHQAGYALKGHDISAQSRTAFESMGGHWCSELSDLSDCAVIVLAVYQTADVEQVANALILATENAAQLHRIELLIDCSTGEPDRLAQLALKLKAVGVDFIEAPLSGSSAQIAQGQATLLLGGAPESIALRADLLRAISPKSIHAGSAGMGARAKLATNLVLGLNRAVLAEGMAFAQSQGIAPEAFLQMVLDSPARSEAAVVKGEKMVNGDFTPQSRIRQHLKDVQVMIQSAEQAGQGLPLTSRIAQVMQAAIEAGDGDLDNAAIVLQMRREKPSNPSSST